MAQTVGGGPKKILYALQTLQRMGPLKGAKALSSNNACKACALGMGGQNGGMVNELGEYPSVCNKSVQAQSTDIQPAIPEAIFDYSLDDFAELSAREMEKLGRLAQPIYKEKGAGRYRIVDWDTAMEIARAKLAAVQPDRSFFYSSGRSSNEAGFLFQLVARLYGTNNVSNCSFYCHQATGVALGETIGTGTATVELADLGGADLIFVIGANPSSNHPRFIHQLKACRDRGGEVIIINPAKEPGLVKFALPKSPKSLLRGGSEIASCYVQPKIGGDIALFKGIAKALMEQDALAPAFIADHTEGFAAFEADIKALSWEEIETRSGVDPDTIHDVARRYARSKSAVFAWGMGMTHHLHGVENIEYIAALALMRGMIGRPHAGLLPLRGHSNVQGIGTIGVKPVLPDDIIKRLEDSFNISLPKTVGLDTMAAMQAAHRGEMDAAVIMGGNLFAANPNERWSRQAMDRIGFKIFLTTTLNKGHVNGHDSSESLVLPVAARDEEWEPTTQESMFNFVRLSDGGLTRFESVRPESVILADLAKRLLPDCPIDFAVFGRHQSLRKAIATVVPGMEELADIDVAKKEFHIRNRLIHKPRFNTADGKAHFRTHDIPAAKTVGGQSAPFTLMTVRSEGQFNSIIYEEKDSYRGTNNRWTVMMNSDDMARLGVAEGDMVDLMSDHGEMKAVYVHGFDLPKGSLMAYYPEANLLTGCEVDPRSKTPAFKSVPVRLERTIQAAE